MLAVLASGQAALLARIRHPGAIRRHDVSHHHSVPQGHFTQNARRATASFARDNEMSDVIAPHAFLNMASISQTILGKIVAAKQEWVAARKESQPLASFQDALTPSDRDFEGDLRKGSTCFILECKKASLQGLDPE